MEKTPFFDNDNEERRDFIFSFNENLQKDDSD